jgi:hypothetical protein
MPDRPHDCRPLAVFEWSWYLKQLDRLVAASESASAITSRARLPLCS